MRGTLFDTAASAGTWFSICRTALFPLCVVAALAEVPAQADTSRPALAARPAPPPRAAYEIPPWLPRYDLNVHIDVANHLVTVKEKVLWTNPCARPTRCIVFNNHAHYTVPDKDVPLFAKTLEVLRLAPSDALDFGGPACQVASVTLLDPQTGQRQALDFFYRPNNATALEVPLPFEVRQGQNVELELCFTLRLPQRQGRWGQWRGVTFLAQWLPVVAYYDHSGWKPTPFIPWHQPFCNEAGVYRAVITLPCDEVIGCTGSIASVSDRKDGWKQVCVGDVCARDFAIFCSKHYREVCGDAGGVRVRCLHLPGHEFYGKQMVRIACEAIPVYAKWFGPFPYPNFTVVESYFGWNGNECGGVVMIDERMFGMPHMAVNYVDSLLTHEICHQWFYNAVGTNGYAETWMDEGLATYFSHRLLDRKLGRNNKILDYPAGLRWLPNIHREDFRNYGMFGTMARGEATATVEEMPNYKHLLTLSAMNYDRGSKIVGMIEQRLGPEGMLDFMKHIYRKYYFRVLHIADFRAELEAYTRHSWQEFFDNWLYGPGMCDWRIDRVEVCPHDAKRDIFDALRRHWPLERGCFLSHLRHEQQNACRPCTVIVEVRQQGEYNEPTVLGIALGACDDYVIRVPILPGVPLLVLDELQAKCESAAPNVVRVTIHLPCEPSQISVDPDQVLLDREPANNHWKTKVRFRLTPFYFNLDETDVTTAYDRPNVIVGPWFYGSTFNYPWFTRAPMFGVRAGIYRTQQYSAGVYLAYRSNDRNVVSGFDALLDHFPFAHTQLGFNAEQSLAALDDEENRTSRAVVYLRHILLYGSSLYLPPFEYVDTFVAVQDRNLPEPDAIIPGAKLFEQQATLGIHYHKYYLTPYWDPEGGVAMDGVYQYGLPAYHDREDFHQVYGQVSTVKYMPDPLGVLEASPLLSWLKETRWAFRLYGAAALPDDAQFFTLGGGELFRGFDLSERQGSMVWVGSVEWRVPLVKGLRADVCDHVAGLRNIYAVAFYDVGNAYIFGKQLGPVAHAVGGGLRFDVSWFGLIERTMLRVDVAQALNSNTPVQFWFGVMHPF